MNDRRRELNRVYSANYYRRKKIEAVAKIDPLDVLIVLQSYPVHPRTRGAGRPRRDGYYSLTTTEICDDLGIDKGIAYWPTAIRSAIKELQDQGYPVVKQWGQWRYVGE